MLDVGIPIETHVVEPQVQSLSPISEACFFGGQVGKWAVGSGRANGASRSRSCADDAGQEVLATHCDG